MLAMMWSRPRWLEELRELSGADFLLLRMADTEAGRLPIVGGVPSTIAWDSLLDLRTADVVEVRAAVTRQDQWFDGNTDFAASDPLRKAGEHICGLAHPLESGGDLAGVLSGSSTKWRVRRSPPSCRAFLKAASWKMKNCSVSSLTLLADVLANSFSSSKKAC